MDDAEVSQYSDEQESLIAERWVHWCRHQENVKCTESNVPQGILPQRHKGILIDVKVGGMKRCPDDKIYSRHEALRSRVARGNCILELNHLSELGVTTTSYFFLVFALKKFSGGMGDEDDEESVQNSWQKYFLKPIEEADKIVVTSKANGEAGHLSSRKIAGQTFFCIGSKNVHLLARDRGDLRHYTGSRYDTALVVARSFFSTYMECPEVKDENRELLISYLQKTKYTAVMEVLQPNYMHIEDLSYLVEPELMFICWTSIYSEDDCSSHCSVAPNVAIDRARHFGLKTISYELINPSEAEEFMLNIRREMGYEGRVLYFMDSDGNIFGLIKKKTAWYIILRALREKACSFSSPKASFSKAEMEQKVTKRLREIQVWLGFSDDYRKTWEMLGVAFVDWLVHKTKKGAGTAPAVRAKFPLLLKEFLETHEKYHDLYSNLTYS